MNNYIKPEIDIHEMECAEYMVSTSTINSYNEDINDASEIDW